jgi:hypothetical protein
MSVHTQETHAFRTHEDERRRGAQEVQLVKAWHEQDLPIFIPAAYDTSIKSWIPATIARVQETKSARESQEASFVLISYQLPDSDERVEKPIFVSELIALQDRYFIDQASELVGKIIRHSHPWLRREDANNDSTGSERYSVLESESPPEETELQEQVADIALEYRRDFLRKNRNSRGTATYYDEVPTLLRAMNSWSHGFATPNEAGIELRKSAYAGWRDQDFAEVCRRIELVLEETQLSILLQEILMYGVEPQGLPTAVSQTTYGEFLLFLENAAGKRRLTSEDPRHTQAEEVPLMDLHKRASLVDAWRAEHTPVHFQLRGDSEHWFQGTWVEGTDLKDDPKNQFEKGVRLRYEVPNATEDESAIRDQWFRLEQVIKAQDQYFLLQAREEMRRLQQAHPWLTSNALEDRDVSGISNSVVDTEFPASEREKREKLATVRQAYRAYTYAQEGLTHRGDPPERRPPEPKMIHLWNAWSHGIGASEGPYENAREVYEPFWTDADYADLCKRIQKEIWVTDASVLLQKILRFGIASTDLPSTVSPKTLLRFLSGLEQLTTSREKEAN